MLLNLLAKLTVSRVCRWPSYSFCALGTSMLTQLFVTCAFSQQQVNYSLLSGGPIGGMKVVSPTPGQFQTINLPSWSTSPVMRAQTTSGTVPNPMSNAASIPGMINVGATEIQRRADIEREEWLKEVNRTEMERVRATQSYRDAFMQFAKMDPNHFSLSQAVYDVENAYLGGQLNLTRFNKILQFHADRVRQILKSEGLRSNRNLSLNYGIQQLFQRANAYYDSSTHVTHTVTPFKYDFEDFMGEKDYTKLFVSKLLTTGTGQCHSLPLTYLLIAEQLGAKAWLSLAPEHSFIQFADNNGRLLDYETTNGHIVSSSWLAGSGYINAKAMRNKLYLDTLSQRQLYARCLSDLLLGYLQHFGYDEFAKRIKNRITEIDPQNVTVLIVDANLKQAVAWQLIKAAGTPKPSDLPKYPEAYQAYLQMKAAVEKLDDTGYQQMPDEAYQEWLKSIETEKAKLSTEKLQQEIKNQVQARKSSLSNRKN